MTNEPYRADGVLTFNTGSSVVLVLLTINSKLPIEHKEVK